MAIALRGAAVVPGGNPTTTYTLTIPSQVLTDDVLFLVNTSRDSTGAGTLSCTDNDTGGNLWAKIGNSTDHKITLWYKRATSATASKTVTIANAVGSCSGVLKCFSGASLGSTPYVDIVVESNISGNETHAGFTPTPANAMVCCGVTNYANDNSVTSLSFATLGATTATQKLSTGGADSGAIFGHALQSGSAAATGDLTWAQTDGATYSIVWSIVPEMLGVVSQTLGMLTSAASAVADVFASLAATLSLATLVGTGAVDVAGTLSRALDAITMSATGTVADAGTNGTLSVTLDALVLSGTGTSWSSSAVYLTYCNALNMMTG